MCTIELRRKIKKAVDRLPADRLETLADFVSLLNRPTLVQRIKKAEQKIASGNGTNWRKARPDAGSHPFARS
jgi:hypothetical protein